jgi:hypothetical protein
VRILYVIPQPPTKILEEICQILSFCKFHNFYFFHFRHRILQDEHLNNFSGQQSLRSGDMYNPDT